MFALVDCNNFYASCERLFQPSLAKRPVVVLSNNDGCTIARSEEAKQIGIQMGTPAFMIADLFKKHDVAVFSSNYPLYGDISDRVMKTLARFAPAMEIYSIDEAFLDLDNMAYTDLGKLALEIRQTIRQDIGIPVSVGIATTKTLAKMANRYAKKKHRQLGVFSADSPALVHEILAYTAVEDIWGIGRQYAAMLKRKGFHTALDLTRAPEDWIRSQMTVVGQRLWNELKGIPATAWQTTQAAKKNICTSRSFGKPTGDKSILAEAASNHAATCAAKLRAQHSCTGFIHVFIHTNQHKIHLPQYARSVTLELETPSNETGTLIHFALKGLDIIFSEGYLFKKIGIMVQGLVPETQVQGGLFDKTDRKKSGALYKTVDELNNWLGRDTVRMAAQGFEKRYRLRADHLSQRYTTRMNEILKVRI